MCKTKWQKRKTNDRQDCTVFTAVGMQYLMSAGICWLILYSAAPPAWSNSHHWVKASSLSILNDHTQTRTLGRCPLDEWSARRRDVYLTTQNTHNRQISYSSDEIRTRDPSKRAATDSQLSAATGTGLLPSLLFPNAQYVRFSHEVSCNGRSSPTPSHRYLNSF